MSSSFHAFLDELEKIAVSLDWVSSKVAPAAAKTTGLRGLFNPAGKARVKGFINRQLGQVEKSRLTDTSPHVENMARKRFTAQDTAMLVGRGFVHPSEFKTAGVLASAALKQIKSRGKP